MGDKMEEEELEKFIETLVVGDRIEVSHKRIDCSHPHSNLYYFLDKKERHSESPMGIAVVRDRCENGKPIGPSNMYGEDFIYLKDILKIAKLGGVSP